jgi:hypothetical protein
MSVQRSETDAKIYKLFWGEHRPSVAFRLRGAELFSRGRRGMEKGIRFNRGIALVERRGNDSGHVRAFDTHPGS